MQEFIRVTKAMADPNRVRILKMLEHRQMCVCEMVAVLDLAQPTISKHLKQLVDAELVATRRQGSWAYYRLTTLEDVVENGPQAAALSFVKSQLNDDTAISGLVSKLPTLSPETLKCPK